MKLILAFDNDKAGKEATKRAINMLLKADEEDRKNLLRWPIFEIIGHGYIGKYHFWTEDEINEIDKITKEYHYRHPSEGELLSIFFPQVKEEKKGITEADIQRAKDVPIDTLLTFNRSKFTKCIFHNDQRPSAYWYESNNKLHCFSCGVSADSIDVVQKLNGLSFNGAVNYFN